MPDVFKNMKTQTIFKKISLTSCSEELVAMAKD